MKEELAKELVEIYPQLFKDQDERICFQLFGFECGSGWFHLLKELIIDLKRICEEQGLEIKAHQVKEKYGKLRFYLSSYTDDLEEAIKRAEQKSGEVCELCGKEGKVGPIRPGSYWLACLCPDCLQNYSAPRALD